MAPIPQIWRSKMASSTSNPSGPSSLHHAYSRKQKSLGLLCSNFLALYNGDGVVVIGIDDAALRLGVERRRIYDIVNVLESVGVLARKAKNLYSWKGFGGIPEALLDLKEQGFKEIYNSQDGNANHFSKLSDDEDDEDRLSNLNSVCQNYISNSTSMLRSSASSKTDSRREKSLGLLTQNFVKLFVCSDAKLISLDEAARLLLGDGHNTSIMRTKVRRLYDIANVLSSINLIEKTHTLDTRKPAFRWLGIGGKPEEAIANVSIFSESRKRVFGSDLTNMSSKRSKLDCSDHDDSKMQKQVKHDRAVNEHDRSSWKQDSKRNLKAYYQFGPFSPVGAPKAHNDLTDSIPKQVNSLESLASSYRPQYHNQALKELFGHYQEAWKSWYSELGHTNPIQQIS